MSRLQNKLEQLRFALYCFKKGQDARFVRNVQQISDHYNMVYVESYGTKKSTEPVFLIDMEESHSGFFAEHNRLLALLYFADKYDMKPVVRFHPGYCYAEQHEVNGTTNPFEYYFEQPAGIALEDVWSYKRVFRSRKENSYEVNHLCEDANGYMRSEKYLTEMARITAKYIRLNAPVKKKLDQEMQELIGAGNVLALHIRGTDFKQNYNGHPVQVGIDEYLDKTLQILQKNPYEKIFLATDDAEAIEEYQKQFGDKVLFYRDVVRSSGSDTVMHSEIPRENHHYLLGYEVLRDMYTLAACDGLIAGLSQVSYAARIQKKSTGKEYRDLVILDKGINYHKKNNCPA